MYRYLHACQYIQYRFMDIPLYNGYTIYALKNKWLVVKTSLNLAQSHKDSAFCQARTHYLTNFPRE